MFGLLQEKNRSSSIIHFSQSSQILSSQNPKSINTMISHRSISRLPAPSGLLNQASRIFRPRSESSLFDANPPSQISQSFNLSSGTEGFKVPMLANPVPRFLGTFGMKLGFLKVNDNVSPPSALSFRSEIHSACPKEFETRENTSSMDFGPKEFETGRNTRSMDFGPREFETRRNNTRSMDFGPRQFETGRNTRSMDFGPRQFETGRNTRSMDFGPKEFETERNTRSMDYVRGILQENRGNVMGGSHLTRYNVERDADMVHIRLMKNNAFITVTDSKGNKKLGVSSGCLPGKISRYTAESTAEHVGRLARNMGLKSFVVKVNGFIHFKKKKQAILSFRDGYTNSRSDQNPIVYIEDTSRRAHNGCRLRKQRRV